MSLVRGLDFFHGGMVLMGPWLVRIKRGNALLDLIKLYAEVMELADNNDLESLA